MPPTLFGDVSIVPSRDLGGLGPRDGQPVQVCIDARWHAVRMLLWLLLAATILYLLRRWRSAWLILLPVGVGYAAIALAGRALPGDVFFNLERDVARSFTLGLAVVWIAVGARGERQGWRTVWLMTAFLTGVGALGILCATGLRVDGSNLGGLCVMTGAAALTLPLAMAAAACWCRRRGYSRKGFVVKLLAGLVALGIVYWTCAMAAFVVATDEVGALGEAAVFALAGGAVSGGLLFAFVLPFLVLTWCVRSYDERFRTVLGVLQPASAADSTRNPPETGPARKRKLGRLM